MRTVIAVALLGLSSVAYATPGCDHPVFYVKGCEYPELNGSDGQDGEDGAPGVAGVDGNDGRDGVDGVDGRDGVDGVDGLDGRNLVESFRRHIAVSSALDIHQSEQGHRVSAGFANSGGAYGFGVGYSYRTDDAVILKAGVGRSGSTSLVQGSVSFEF